MKGGVVDEKDLGDLVDITDGIDDFYWGLGLSDTEYNFLCQ